MKHHKKNHEIHAPQVRFVNAEGTMIGVVNLSFALAEAKKAGLDLVEIAPQAKPPVCKILNYSKFRYNEQKRKNEQKKNQKIVDTKEVQVSVRIEAHDFDVKMKRSVKFLEEGHKVKVVLRFWGRQMAHQDLGRQVLERCQTYLQTHAKAKVDVSPKMEGKRLFLIMSPDKDLIKPAA